MRNTSPQAAASRASKSLFLLKRALLISKPLRLQRRPTKNTNATSYFLKLLRSKGPRPLTDLLGLIRRPPVSAAISPPIGQADVDSKLAHNLNPTWEFDHPQRNNEKTKNRNTRLSSNTPRQGPSTERKPRNTDPLRCTPIPLASHDDRANAPLLERLFAETPSPEDHLKPCFCTGGFTSPPPPDGRTKKKERSWTHTADISPNKLTAGTAYLPRPNRTKNAVYTPHETQPGALTFHPVPNPTTYSSSLAGLCRKEREA